MLVAVVVIATAAIMLFIFTGESSSFSEFVSDRITDAEDDLEDVGGNGGIDCPNENPCLSGCEMVSENPPICEPI